MEKAPDDSRNIKALGGERTREEIIEALRAYFNEKHRVFPMVAAFLFGSWASGFPRRDSDVDIAVIFDKPMRDEEIFEAILAISLELTDILNKNVNTIFIDEYFSKPMLYYNAIVKGVPVFISDFTKYVDIKLHALAQMEDFSLFGIQWLAEIARKRLEALEHA